MPTGGTFDYSDVTVTISLFDDYGLNTGSYSETITGATILSATGPDWSGGGFSQGTRVLNLRLPAGSNNSVAVHVCDNIGQCRDLSAFYTYNQPPAPPPQAPPTISLAPHNGDNRDPARCVANCFESTLSYTTPAYMSLDVPRAVTLVYSRAHVMTRATLQVDAVDNSATAPDKMSLRLKRPDNTWVTFTTGSDEVFFASGAGASRLGAQFDVTSLGTGAHSYTVVVRSWWGSTSLEATAPIKILVYRETATAYGYGWWIAGLQRVIWQADGIIVLGEAGSIAFFANCPTACSTYVSPSGDFSTFTWVGGVNGVYYRRRWPDGTTADFNWHGQMTTLQDRYGNSVVYTYNQASMLGSLASIADPAGAVTAFGYDANGKLDYIQDPGGRVTQVTVNASGDLVDVFDPDNVRALLVSYDAGHVPQMVQDRRGGQTSFAYDFTGKMASVTLPLITADGGPVQPVLTLRSLEKRVLVDPASGQGTWGTPATPRRRPDSLRATVLAPKGDSTVYALDRFGSATRIEYRDPQGKWQVATRSYDSQGRLVAAATPPGGSVGYSWNGPRLISMTNHKTGLVTTYEHELTYNQVTRAFVSGALQLEHFYGTLGRLDSTKVGTSKTSYTYDTRGRVLNITDPQQHVTSFFYKPGGLQSTDSVRAPRGDGLIGTTKFVYDIHGRPSSLTDPAARTVTTGYDLVNRVTSVMAPLNTLTQYGYDDAARRDSLIDPKGQIYKALSNALGWVEQRIDPRASIESFSYDKNGNITRYTNRRGQFVDYTYDASNRVQTITAGGQTTTFAYDSAGRWVFAGNSESADTIKLDPDGRPTEMFIARGGLKFRLTSNYTNEGLRNKLTANGLSPTWGPVDIDFGYDAQFRFSYLEDFSARVSTITYNTEQMPSLLTFPIITSGANKLEQTRTYTSAHQLSRVSYNWAQIHTLLSREYRYDAVGRADTIKWAQQGDDWTGFRRVLSYNSLDRLTSYRDYHDWKEIVFICPTPETCYEQTNYYSDLLQQDNYSYDAVGNRQDHGAVIETGNRITSFDGYTLEYDADGNVIRKYKPGVSDQYLTWNARGQLTQVVTNGETTTFGYDGLGRRARKTTGSTTTRYLWDGDDLVLELDGAGNRLREYTHLPGTDAPHSVRRSSDGAVFYYATERPGQVAGLIDLSKNIVNRYEYTPWGEAITTIEGVTQPFRYAAREYDAETGLYYVRARYYDPKMGRFISEDPIGLAGGINPYAYVANSPTNATDPSGLSQICYWTPLYTQRSYNGGRSWITVGVEWLFEGCFRDMMPSADEMGFSGVQEAPTIPCIFGTDGGTVVADEEIAKKLRAFINAGVQFTGTSVNSSLRSSGKQYAMWYDWKYGGNKGGYKVVGEQSCHEAGFCVDLNYETLNSGFARATLDWLANFYGFKRLEGDGGHYYYAPNGVQSFGQYADLAAAINVAQDALKSGQVRACK